MAIGTRNTEQIVDIDNLPADFGEPPLSWPKLTDIDLDEVAVSYYAPYDLLSIDFLGVPVPAINMPLDPPDSGRGYAEARIGLASE